MGSMGFPSSLASYKLTTRRSLKVREFAAPRLVRMQKEDSFEAGRSISFSNAESEGHKKIAEGDGVVIVDHGSRRKESNLMLNEFVTMFRERTGYPIVEPAHMELAEPTIKDAFRSCVQQGATRIIVSPYFLFPGKHWKQDIPSLAAEAAMDHPNLSYIITAPLGLHELMVDVVNDRIMHCLSHVEGKAEECAACAGTSNCRQY